MNAEELQMTVYDVVMKLIGPIEPIGESREDERRFDNLVAVTKLVAVLLADINDVTSHKSRIEYSMRKAGEYADKFLTRMGIEQ